MSTARVWIRVDQIYTSQVRHYTRREEKEVFNQVISYLINAIEGVKCIDLIELAREGHIVWIADNLDVFTIEDQHAFKTMIDIGMRLNPHETFNRLHSFESKVESAFIQRKKEEYLDRFPVESYDMMRSLGNILPETTLYLAARAIANDPFNVVSYLSHFSISQEKKKEVFLRATEMDRRVYAEVGSFRFDSSTLQELACQAVQKNPLNFNYYLQIFHRVDRSQLVEEFTRTAADRILSTHSAKRLEVALEIAAHNLDHLVIFGDILNFSNLDQLKTFLEKLICLCPLSINKILKSVDSLNRDVLLYLLAVAMTVYPFGIKKLLQLYEICSEEKKVILSIALEKNTINTARHIDQFELNEEERKYFAAYAIQKDPLNFNQYIQIFAVQLKDIISLFEEKELSDLTYSIVNKRVHFREKIREFRYFGRTCYRFRKDFLKRLGAIIAIHSFCIEECLRFYAVKKEEIKTVLEGAFEQNMGSIIPHIALFQLEQKERVYFALRAIQQDPYRFSQYIQIFSVSQEEVIRQLEKAPFYERYRHIIERQLVLPYSLRAQ